MPGTPADDDAALFRRARRGDMAAFGQFVARHQDRLYRLAGVWLADASRAEDAAQEAFLRVLRGIGGFRFRAAPFSWLYRTLRNVCHELNRDRRFEPLAPSHEPVSRDTDPAMTIGALQTARQLRQWVDALPVRQQEVVVLRIYESLSVRETAEAMGCREGTVKALLHKATQHLRTLGAELPDGDAT